MEQTTPIQSPARSVSPVKGITLHGPKKGGAVQLEEGAITLGREDSISEQDVQAVLTSLARMGIDTSHITYSLEPADAERKRTQKPGDPPPESDEGKRVFTISLKNLHHLNDKKGITDDALLSGLKQDGMISAPEEQQYKQEADARNRGFFERLTKEGPGSAIRHLYKNAAVTLVGAMYITDDTIGLTYAHLLNRQTLAKRGIGDLGLSALSLIGSSSMFLWGNTRSKKTNEEKEMVRFREAMKQAPFGQSLSEGLAEETDERTGGERFREFMEANAAKIGTGGNAFSTLFIAKSAYDQSTKGNIDVPGWVQFATACSGFTLSTMSSREGVDFEESRMGKFIGSNPVTGVLEKPARGLFGLLQSRPYLPVGLVMIYNSIGMWRGWNNKQRSDPARAQIQKEYGGKQYHRIDPENGIEYNEETGEVTLRSPANDKEWWHAVDDKKGSDLDDGVDELRNLVAIRGSGWVVKDTASGELRPPSDEERTFLMLQDMRDESGALLPESTQKSLQSKLDKQQIKVTLHGDATNADTFRDQNRIEATVEHRKEGGSSTVEFYRLDASDRVDGSKFRNSIVEYQMFERLRDYSWLYMAKNVWMFITNGLFALAPKPDSRIDPEAQCSLIAMDILNSVEEGLQAGMTDNQLRTQSIERLKYAADYFAQQPAMKYAAKQGLIQVNEGETLRDAMIDKINDMAVRMAPLTDRTRALQVWNIVYNDESAQLAAEYGRDVKAPGIGMAQSLSQEQGRQPSVTSGTSAPEDQVVLPADVSPEMLQSYLQEMRANPDQYTEQQVQHMENMILQVAQQDGADVPQYVH